jgi:hypothetical protein
MVIDIHNHFFPAAWPDLAERYGTPNWPWIKHTDSGKADIMVGELFFRHIYSACWDPEVRLPTTVRWNMHWIARGCLMTRRSSFAAVAEAA